MFTGIIEEVGTIKRIQPISGGKKIDISADKILDDLKVDHSVAVSGICLTVIEIKNNIISAEAVGETLEKTTAGSWRTGEKVNLERAMRLSDRIGGHIVQGHVNGTAQVIAMKRRGENWFLEIELPSELLRFVIAEGSIACDGISLTVTRISGLNVGISVIPHTYQNTTIQLLKTGSRVNIETDFLGRYVENILRHSKGEAPFSPEWFERLGY